MGHFHLPKGPLKPPALHRLAGDICSNYATLRLPGIIQSLDQKMMGFHSPYLLSYWEEAERRIFMPKGWKHWVRDGLFDAHHDVDLETAVATMVGSLRIISEAQGYWELAQKKLGMLSIDIGPIPRFYAVKASDLLSDADNGVEIKFFPWLDALEEASIGGGESISRQYLWPDEQTRRVFSIVARWELYRRDVGVSFLCPAYPIAAMMSLGLVLSADEVFVPCGNPRSS